MDQITTEARTSTEQNWPAANTSAAPGPSFVEALVDPVNLFHHPASVAEHPWFTDEEKRTILLSWARDELVVEQVASKVAPDLHVKSRIDAVLEVLSQFDPAAATEYLSAVASIRAGNPRQIKRKASTRNLS
jgi:hypothetical protein